MNATCSSVYDLFERVLREGPKPDEIEFWDDGPSLVLSLDEAPFGCGDNWSHADYVPGQDEFYYERPSARKAREGLAPDITLRCTNHIRIMPHPVVYTIGIWIINPFLEQPNHIFGLRGELVTHGHVDDRMTDPNYLNRHVFETEDEVVVATITCINARSQNDMVMQVKCQKN